MLLLNKLHDIVQASLSFKGQETLEKEMNGQRIAIDVCLTTIVCEIMEDRQNVCYYGQQLSVWNTWWQQCQ